MNMVDSNFITVEHLPHQILSSLSEKPPENGIMPLEKVVEQVFKEAVRRYGKSEEGKLQIAKALGVSRSTVYRKIKEYGL